jgi:hypothetical protein
MIKLGVGKSYHTRGESVAHITERSTDGLYFVGEVEGIERRWRENGRYWLEGLDELDIVGERVDQPLTQPTEPDVKARIAAEAARIVTGERRGAYGSPENNFERIARFWTAHLANRYGDDKKFHLGPPKLDGTDVALMMVLLKAARLANQPDHRDSWVDISGYAACGGSISKKA